MEAIKHKQFYITIFTDVTMCEAKKLHCTLSHRHQHFEGGMHIHGVTMGRKWNTPRKVCMSEKMGQMYIHCIKVISLKLSFLLANGTWDREILSNVKGYQ